MSRTAQFSIQTGFASTAYRPVMFTVSMQRVSEPLFCHTLALRLRLLKLLNCVMWEAGQLLTINHYVSADSERWKIREEPDIRVDVCRFDGWVYTNRKL